MSKLAVVIPVRNEETIADLLEGIFFSTPRGFDVCVILVVNNSTPEFEEFVNAIAKRDARVHALQLGQLEPRTFAYAYLRGLEYAVEGIGAEYVVEMDGGGSHDPSDLPSFVRGLEAADAALSTRFSHGGRMVHPLRRRVVSFCGTLLANLLLDLGRFVPDMTSGYEAFRRDMLKCLFKLVSPDVWISVNEGPGHFYQTEMRTYLCWMGVRVSLVPIVMGAGKVRKPQRMGLRRLFRALKSLLVLRGRRRDFISRTISQI